MVFVFGTIAWLAVAANNAQAGVEVTWESYPTAGLEGYTTYIVSVESDIGGFKSFGVYFETEHFNQIRAIDSSTPTQDWNDLLQVVGEEPLHDTQMMFDSEDVEMCYVEVCFQETDLIIEGNQLFRQYYDSRNLAQLVVPAGNTVSYRVGVVVSSVEYWETGIIPEPASFAIIAAAGLVLLPPRRC